VFFDLSGDLKSCSGAGGRNLNVGSYNAAGQIFETPVGDDVIRRSYSGDGSESKRSVMVWDVPTGAWTVSSSSYLINSTVLGGQLVTEVNNTGRKLQTYVIAAGAVIARQLVNTPDTSPTESVSWEHRDPGDTEVKYTNSTGGSSTDFVSSHYDPIGRMVGTPSFTSPTTSPHNIPSPFEEVPEELGSNQPCQVEVDGMLQDCDTVSADNTHVELRDGNKVYSTPLHEMLPGSGVFTFDVTFQGDAYGEGRVIHSDDEYIDESAQSTPIHTITMSFTMSWNFRDPGSAQRQSAAPNVSGRPLTKSEQDSLDGGLSKAESTLKNNSSCRKAIAGIIQATHRKKPVSRLRFCDFPLGFRGLWRDG
jgi:hypothetical protein